MFGVYMQDRLQPVCNESKGDMSGVGVIIGV